MESQATSELADRALAGFWGLAACRLAFHQRSFSVEGCGLLGAFREVHKNIMLDLLAWG